MTVDIKATCTISTVERTATTAEPDGSRVTIVIDFPAPLSADMRAWIEDWYSDFGRRMKVAHLLEERND